MANLVGDAGGENDKGKLPQCTTETGEAVAAYISTLHDFAGASGVYDFRSGDHHGLTDADLVWVKYQPGSETKFVPVSRPGGIPL